MDYSSLFRAGITFDPYGPTTGCVDIFINRDFLVEYTESFSFNIDEDQDDDSVLVGFPDSAIVDILDEEEGMGVLICVE